MHIDEVGVLTLSADEELFYTGRIIESRLPFLSERIKFNYKIGAILSITYNQTQTILDKHNSAIYTFDYGLDKSANPG